LHYQFGELSARASAYGHHFAVVNLVAGKSCRDIRDAGNREHFHAAMARNYRFGHG
jgi:hypothetical protein